MSRPRVYRAIDDLAARGLIAPTGTAPSDRGPTRTLYDATDAGRARLEEWLRTPVDHVREMRSDLLLKLAILHERGTPADGLLDAQRAKLVPVLQQPRDGDLGRERVRAGHAALPARVDAQRNPVHRRGSRLPRWTRLGPATLVVNYGLACCAYSYAIPWSA